MYLPHLQCKVRAVLDFVLSGRLVRFALPPMRFLFVRPGVCPCRHFTASTSGFLQIPPHDGHPCLRLTVPTAKSVVDFHHRVIAHAGRTSSKNPLPGRGAQAKLPCRKSRHESSSPCRKAGLKRAALPGRWALGFSPQGLPPEL